MKPSRILPVAVFATILLPFVLVRAQEEKGADKKPVEKFLNSFSEPIRIQESKPKTVNDAQFVVVAQTNWKPPKRDDFFPVVAPIEIQLHITNQSMSDILFLTQNTFGIRILDAEGKQVKCGGNRGGPNSTKPVLLPGGASYSLCRRAELRQDEKTKASELLYYDGTGAKSVIGPLKAGRYKLVFWYSVSAKQQEKRIHGDAPAWIGEIVTNEVPIDVLNDTTAGRLTESEDMRPSIEPLRIRESKTVTVNEAKFVAVAETSWKPKKNVKAGRGGLVRGVPIEIQLGITNLSKSDLIFPTFDTFGLVILNAEGKRIIPRGGRSATVLTRPISLPAGASCSLSTVSEPNAVCRKAELLWDEKTKATELVYFDGTGRAVIFGPLEPGRYQLTFGYGVSRHDPLKTERDPATWLGNAVTGGVPIDVSAP